jgi:hypothetical protein
VANDSATATINLETLLFLAEPKALIRCQGERFAFLVELDHSVDKFNRRYCSFVLRLVMWCPSRSFLHQAVDWIYAPATLDSASEESGSAR